MPVPPSPERLTVGLALHKDFHTEKAHGATECERPGVRAAVPHTVSLRPGSVSGALTRIRESWGRVWSVLRVTAAFPRL